MSVYGYCRISKPSQNIERQVRNILRAYPDAEIIEETYTGTKFQGRKKFNALMGRVKEGDTIVFDSVSRMSRNADEGFQLYQDLFNKGIQLVFIKEPQINTSTYAEALNNQISMTGGLVDTILSGVNDYLLAIAKVQIRLAFEQSEKEVSDLRQRTREGMETARLAGKQIGRQKGSTYDTRVGNKVQKLIKERSKDFGGCLNDSEIIKIAECSPTTYYKYKHILEREEEGAEE